MPFPVACRSATARAAARTHRMGRCVPDVYAARTPPNVRRQGALPGAVSYRCSRFCAGALQRLPHARRRVTPFRSRAPRATPLRRMTRARRALRTAAVSIVAAGCAALALAAGGELDPSFAGDGWAEVDLGEAEFAHAVAVQRNGRIVVAGETDCPLAVCFALVRFLPDGHLDWSFGANGVVRTMFARYGASRAYDVAVQPNGRIVAVGMRFRGGDAQDDELFAVARYLPDGRLDRSFSRDGLASVDFGFGDADAAAVALQPNGKILVA